MKPNKIILSTVLFLIYSSVVFSQELNSLWLFGYQNGGGTGFGGSDINFSTPSPTISYHFRPMDFDAASAEICDSIGNLLFYTNGIYIANGTDQPMLNGTGLNPGQFATAYSNYGIPIVQGELIFPKPGSATNYYLFHVVGSYLPQGVQPLELYYTEVDMTLDSGLGGVVTKNNIAISDTLCMGDITATKHGNGRDWWVLIPKWNSNGYYTVLVTPSGVSAPTLQNIGFSCGIFDWSGQTVFSPDGSKLARYDKDNELNIFDFDRCTGLLSNPIHIVINDSAVAGGVAFSSNSRFLYITSTYDIYQFDMMSSPIDSSQLTVAHFDGNASPFATTFFMEQIGPNGKIYINSTNGENVLGRIDSPDSAGLSCNVLQHSVQLPTYNSTSMPNFPNYLLGRKIGSPCDSLTGIDQLSLQNFHLTISPNPSSGNFEIKYLLPENKIGVFEIYDTNDKIIYSQKLPQWSTLQQINLPNINSGFYFCSITSGHSKVTQKLVVIK